MIKSVQSSQSLKKELDKLGVYVGFFWVQTQVTGESLVSTQIQQIKELK